MAGRTTGPWLGAPLACSSMSATLACKLQATSIWQRCLHSGSTTSVCSRHSFLANCCLPVGYKQLLAPLLMAGTTCLSIYDASPRSKVISFKLSTFFLSTLLPQAAGHNVWHRPEVAWDTNTDTAQAKLQVRHRATVWWWPHAHNHAYCAFCIVPAWEGAPVSVLQLSCTRPQACVIRLERSTASQTDRSSGQRCYFKSDA